MLYIPIHMTATPWEHLKGPKRLRRWRTQIVHLSQIDLARMIGADSARISRYESGAARPCLDLAARLHKATRGYVAIDQWTDVKL